MFGKKILALFAALAVIISQYPLLAFVSDGAEQEALMEDIVTEEPATPGVTDPETVSEEDNPELTFDKDDTELTLEENDTGLAFEVKDPYDLDGMQRISAYSPRVYNASGFIGEGSYLYGSQLPPDSAARMVYNALKDAWLGVNPAEIEPQVTVDFGDKKIPMRTTLNGIYNNSGYWDTQSVKNFELAAQCAIDAFFYDFPDVFWMKFGTGGMWYTAASQAEGDGVNFYIVSITLNASVIDSASAYYTALDNKIGVLSAQFASGAAKSYDKIKNAHNYIATHIEYGYTSMFGNPHTRTPYGTLFGDYVVCEGYARTFKLFCDRFNIPSVLVMGYAEPQHVLHMWNAVKLDGKWYIVDVTWDDTGGSNGVKQAYFLAGLDTVVSAQPGYTTPRANHVPAGVINSSALVFSYPSINSSSHPQSSASASTTPSGSSPYPGSSSSKSSGSGGGSGGGGGGGGSASAGTITGIVNNKPMGVTANTADAAVKNAVNAAKTSGSSIANVVFKNPGKITLETIKKIAETAGMPVKLTADSMSADGKSVDVRIRLDPAKATAGLELAASISDEQAAKMNTNFSKWFKNAVQPVSLAQREAFGQEIEFFVKLDPKLDKENLKLYRYDGKAYQLLPNQGYNITKSGYVKFYADPAGDIIISGGDLVRK